ncbi:MAG: T9SS type A sorting domain-containing protein, partial [Bacteroidota bacterium]|nr:T9SS type A sorting domain-containing protein [Bacteroidota bacterium]
MKPIQARLILLAAIAFIVLPGLCLGQSITIGSVSASSFCTGDPVSVTFTATGTWGHKNAFTVQLSNPNGGFGTGFRNIGSVADEVGGTLTVNTTIPTGIAASTHYRFRVIGAVPYTVSADNGSDDTIGVKPTIWISHSPSTAASGDLISFQAMGGGSPDSGSATPASIHWNFGADASPDSADGLVVNNIVYSHGGDKTVTVTATSIGGCTSVSTFTIRIFDCSPKIPADANVVVTSDSIVDNGGNTYWVNPGVTFSGSGSCTIFAEAGATITSGGSCTIYLKAGAEYLETGSGSILFVYENGASIPLPLSNSNTAIECSSLNFDYTNAPPNRAFQKNAVGSDLQNHPIEISPNPTSGAIKVTGIPLSTTRVTILNLLGNVAMDLPLPHADNISVDLSKLRAGTYYLRVVSGNE